MFDQILPILSLEEKIVIGAVLAASVILVIFIRGTREINLSKRATKKIQEKIYTERGFIYCSVDSLSIELNHTGGYLYLTGKIMAEDLDIEIVELDLAMQFRSDEMAVKIVSPDSQIVYQHDPLSYIESAQVYTTIKILNEPFYLEANRKYNFILPVSVSQDQILKVTNQLIESIENIVKTEKENTDLESIYKNEQIIFKQKIAYQDLLKISPYKAGEYKIRIKMKAAMKEQIISLNFELKEEDLSLLESNLEKIPSSMLRIYLEEPLDEYNELILEKTRVSQRFTV